MRVAVLGLWHLGSVLAARAAELGHEVVGFDEDPVAVSRFLSGNGPVAEPGLPELLAQSLKKGLLSASSDPKKLRGCELFWISHDTPVNSEDQADVGWVAERLRRALVFLDSGGSVAVSSQLPVGTLRQWSKEGVPVLACIPENLRLGQALRCFPGEGPIPVGILSDTSRARVQELLKFPGVGFDWMSLESAEMLKHARNAFLATDISLTNELARLAGLLGADWREVERGLRSDRRIGSSAYVRAGGAFSGGTLGRDLRYLKQLAQAQGESLLAVSGAIASNGHHSLWAREQLLKGLGTLNGRVIAMLGVSSKAETGSLRRSAALADALWLVEQGVRVTVFDPTLQRAELQGAAPGLEARDSLEKAVENADAIVVNTPRAEFQGLAEILGRKDRRPALVLDVFRELEGLLAQVPGIQYRAVGCLSGTRDRN